MVSGLFVPGSERSTDGTFGPVDRKVQELSLHETFAPVELLLLGANAPRTFAPWQWRRGTWCVVVGQKVRKPGENPTKQKSYTVRTGIKYCLRKSGSPTCGLLWTKMTIT